MSLVPQYPDTATANESLAQTLIIGNVSGANDIAMSSPQKIDFAGDISLKNGVGGDVLIDAVPLNSGTALNTAMFYEVGTNRVVYQTLSPTSETLSQTLALGNSTGPFNISVASPQRIDFDGSIRLSNNNTGAGADVVISSIPANGGAPINTALVYDVGSGRVLTQTSVANSLASVLTAGNTTGASDINVTSPQKVNFAGDISLKNGTGANVIIDTIPLNAGPSLTTALYYDTGTKQVKYQNLTPSTEDLTQTLALGNTTGPYDIVVSSPQKISFVGDITLQSGAGANVVVNALPINNSSPFFEVQYDPTTFRLYYAPATSQLCPQISQCQMASNQSDFPILAGTFGELNFSFSGAIANMIITGVPQYPDLVWMVDFSAVEILWSTGTGGYNPNDIIDLSWTDGPHEYFLNTPPYDQLIQSSQVLYPSPNMKSGSIGNVPVPVNILHSMGFSPTATDLRLYNRATGAGVDLNIGTFPFAIYATLYPNGILI